MHELLRWKHNSNWPYNEKRALRQLTRMDTIRLKDVKRRQEASRSISPAPFSAIVADLSVGVWVSQLSRSDEIPSAWRHNVTRIFPHDKALDMRAAWWICDELLTLRNRIAYHEPIFDLPLEHRHGDLERITVAMCPGDVRPRGGVVYVHRGMAVSPLARSVRTFLTCLSKTTHLVRGPAMTVWPSAPLPR